MRRWLITILIFLLGGAVANVGVAWGCEAWISVSPAGIRGSFSATSPFDDTGGASVMVFEGAGATRIYSFHQSDPSSLARLKRSQVTLDVPEWARSGGSARTFRQGAQVVEVVDARGWPFLSLCARGVFAHDSWKERGPLVLLPRRPLWAGFTLNSLLYGAVLALPFALFKLRHHIRLRRSRCPVCGYPIGESSTCTECGRPLPHRAVV